MDFRQYYIDLKEAEQLEHLENKHEEAISLLLPYLKYVDKEVSSYENPVFFKRPIEKDMYVNNKFLFEEYTELEQDYFTFYFILGVAFFNLNSYLNAQRYLECAWSLNPANSYANNYLTQAMLMKGDDINEFYPLVLNILDFTFNPIELAFAYETYAMCFLRQNERIPAITCFVLAYKYLPKQEYLEFIKRLTDEDNPDLYYFSDDFINTVAKEYDFETTYSKSMKISLVDFLNLAYRTNDTEATLYYLDILKNMDLKFKRLKENLLSGKKIKMPSSVRLAKKIYYRDIKERDQKLSKKYGR